MPSRRAILAGASALGGSGGLGWLLTGGRLTTGEVVLKRIDVCWRYSGGARWNGYLLRSLLGPGDQGVLTYDPSYAGGAVADPLGITVDAAMGDRLEREFQNVEYLVGVCGTAPGEVCSFRSRRVDREAFNRVRLGGEATVAAVDDSLFVLDASDPAAAPTGVDVEEFDFDERHAARGR